LANKYIATHFYLWQHQGMNTLELYRKANGMSVTDISVKLGISMAYASRLLSGKRTPGLNLACKIERITDGAVTTTSWRIKDAA
jgi:transcriptional regulator with XRE-family HTH domain